jgi:hypothetical protein
LPAGAAFALFALLASPSDWSRPELVAALAATAVVAFLAETRLKAAVAVYFDASLVLALLTLAIAGPIPALVVWVIPDVITRLVIRRSPLLSPGLVANVSSYALAVLAGEGVLALADPSSLAAAVPALYTAGLVMWVVNFTFARLAFAPFYQGFRPVALIRSELVEYSMPPTLAMLVLAAVTALLIPTLGVFALMPLILVVVLPQLAMAALVRGRSVAGLSRDQATALYAAAIADVMALDRSDRRIVACTLDLLADGDDGPAEPQGDWSFEHVPEVVQAALHARERWDGKGTPAGLLGGWTPLASRIVAVGRGARPRPPAPWSSRRPTRCSI